MTTPAYMIARNIVLAADGYLVATITGYDDEGQPRGFALTQAELDAREDGDVTTHHPPMRGGERFEAYWNQAPDQKGGRVYALFAFRSTIYAQDLAGGQTRGVTQRSWNYTSSRAWVVRRRDTTWQRQSYRSSASQN